MIIDLLSLLLLNLDTFAGLVMRIGIVRILQWSLMTVIKL